MSVGVDGGRPEKLLNDAPFLVGRSTGESNKRKASADVRFALEVFENDERVKAARIRIDDGTSSNYKRSKSVRNLQGIRDGLQPNRGGKLREREFAASGFRLTDNISRIKAKLNDAPFLVGRSTEGWY